MKELDYEFKDTVRYSRSVAQHKQKYIHFSFLSYSPEMKIYTPSERHLMDLSTIGTKTMLKIMRGKQ